MSRREQMSIGQLTVEEVLVGGTAIEISPAVLNYAIRGSVADLKIVNGQYSMTATMIKTLSALGLSAVSNVMVTHYKAATAPTIQAVSYYVTTGGTLTVYAWQATSAATTTLVANTAAATMNYTIIGTAA